MHLLSLKKISSECKRSITRKPERLEHNEECRNIVKNKEEDREDYKNWEKNKEIVIQKFGWAG